MTDRARNSAGERLSKQAAYYIREHSGQKFSLGKIAGALFVNGSYLSRVFRRETGYTLLWYHNHVRCEKAKELLVHTDRGLAEIGSAVGFVSSAHFSHVFRKMEGCAPSAYRTGSPDRRAAGIRQEDFPSGQEHPDIRKGTDA